MSSDTPEEDRPELAAEVAPDDFLDTWGASSYERALTLAEQAETTTSNSDRPRCPKCGSLGVRQKHGGDQSHKIDSEYLCENAHHFDDPVYGDPDELDLRDEDHDEADDTTDRDPFVWVSAEDLAEPPLARQLAALDDDALAALAIFLYRPWNHTEEDPSYRELARIFPYSRVWIGDRIRAWNDGELRDLVADPRPRVRLAADAEEVAAE